MDTCKITRVLSSHTPFHAKLLGATHAQMQDFQPAARQPPGIADYESTSSYGTPASPWLFPSCSPPHTLCWLQAHGTLGLARGFTRPARWRCYTDTDVNTNCLIEYITYTCKKNWCLLSWAAGPIMGRFVLGLIRTDTWVYTYIYKAPPKLSQRKKNWFIATQ